MTARVFVQKFRGLLIRYPIPATTTTITAAKTITTKTVAATATTTTNNNQCYNVPTTMYSFCGGSIIYINKNVWWNLSIQRNYSSTIFSSSESGDVYIEYINGFPHFTIPLPSRNERCRFALKPLSHTVGHFIDMIKVEDRGIDRAAILNNDGIRIASSCTIESILDEPFWIHINDQKYFVVPPKRSKVLLEDLNKLDNLRLLVGQLYEALNVGEYHVQKEQELVKRLEDLKFKLAPMEDEKNELSEQARRKTTFLNWFGLSMMSVQFGILARLTWWEYSWDIMEPVTYFVTYGTSMAMYAYYCLTRTEYNMPDVNKRQYLFAIYRRAKNKNFNVEEYNNLKRQVAEIEDDLKRLRDPLNFQLPPHINRSQRNKPQDKTYKEIQAATVTTKKKSSLNLPFLTAKS